MPRSRPNGIRRNWGSRSGIIRAIGSPSHRGERTSPSICAKGSIRWSRGTPGSPSRRPTQREEAALRKLGVEFTTPTTKEDWATYAMFKDPDGNEFYLIEE